VVGLLGRERDVDIDRDAGQDDADYQQFFQRFSLLRLDGVAFLEGEEPGVEAAGGDEVLVGAGLGDAALFEDQDLVHVPH
jgi:hypothetical protein